MIDPPVWPTSAMGWCSWCGGEQEGQPRCGDENESIWVEKVAPGLREGTVCTLCVQLHTRVGGKPCLRKMHAGPTMLCSMLQFFTSAPKGSLNSLSSTPWSSFPSSCRPCTPTALTFPSTASFRGRPGCYSTTTLSALWISSHIKQKLSRNRFSSHADIR